MQFASHLARSADLPAAVSEAADALSAALTAPPTVLFAFVRAADPNDYRRLPELLAARFPGVPVFGCAARGVIGDGREEEDQPALSLTAASLPGAALRVVHVAPDAVLVDGEPDRARLAAALGLGAGAQPDALVLVDPFTLPPDPLLAALDGLLPDATKIGALAADGPVPRSSMLYGAVAHRSGALVLLLEGDVRLRPLVAQGCRPIGRPYVITRIDEGAILELDGKPALEQLKTLHGSLPAVDRELFRHSLFVGIEMDKSSVEVHTDRLLVRNLIGVDPEHGAIGVAAELKRHDVIHFVLRDSASAATELSSLLMRTQGEGARPVGALLFSCLGRGRHLFGRVDHDPDLFHEAFPNVALGGFFANGEIAPVGGRTFLHGYTSAFALFEPR